MQGRVSMTMGDLQEVVFLYVSSGVGCSMPRLRRQVLPFVTYILLCSCVLATKKNQLCPLHP